MPVKNLTQSTKSESVQRATRKYKRKETLVKKMTELVENDDDLKMCLILY